MTAKRKPTRRPYRVELIGEGRMRRRSYSTCERAVQAALVDAAIDSDLYLTAHRRYVIEHHTSHGPWLPIQVVTADGTGRELSRESCSHLTVVVA